MGKVSYVQFGDAFSKQQLCKKWFEEGIVGVRKEETVKTITFQVTEACNLNCSYCYQINKSINKMTFDTAKRFIDMLIEDSYKEDSYVYIKNTPAVIIEFIGGEPLLEVNLISDIIDYFKFITVSKRHIWAKNHMFSMISNGVLYFDDNVQRLLNRNKYKLDFSISLDGCKELHDSCRVFDNGSGSYDIAMNGCIHYMKNYNEHMSTKMTLAPQNIDWLYRAFVNLHGLGYKVIHSNCIYEDGWNDSHAKIFYNELKKVGDYILDNNLEDDIYCSLFMDNGFMPMKEIDNDNYCGTTGAMLALDYKGDIYTCLRFMQSSLGKDIEGFSIGSLGSGIGRNPNHVNRINILSSITRRSQSNDECFNCSVAAGCGNCTALNYQMHGTPDKKSTYACDMHKVRGLGNVYYWNKYYAKKGMDKKFINYLDKDGCLRFIDEEEYNMLMRL